MSADNCDGQLDLLDLVDGTEPVGNPAVITVHCFFARWCNYVVRDINPEAGRRMEAHYVAKHYGKHLATVYKEINQ